MVTSKNCLLYHSVLKGKDEVASGNSLLCLLPFVIARSVTTKNSVSEANNLYNHTEKQEIASAQLILPVVGCFARNDSPVFRIFRGHLNY